MAAQIISNKQCIAFGGMAASNVDGRVHYVRKVSAAREDSHH
jgi:hypothetical protein